MYELLKVNDDGSAEYERLPRNGVTFFTSEEGAQEYVANLEAGDGIPSDNSNS